MTIATPEHLTIRRAQSADRESLIRLAGRDSKRLPSGTFLIAELEGEPWAAVALESGEVVADPFHRTAELVGILRLRAARISEAETPDLARRKRGRVKVAAATLLRWCGRQPVESRLN